MNDTATGGRIAIIGAGLIGRSWTALFARAGLDVQIWDPDEKVRADFPSAFAALARGLAAEGMMDDPEGAAARVTVARTLEEAVAGAGFVQENGPEDREVKIDLFTRIDRAAEEDAVLASSTSAIVPSLFTEALPGRHRCLVGHPVNPPHLIPVVELCPAPWTDDATMDRAEALYARIGQSPVRMTRELDGFVLNRLQGALLAEAMRLLGDGIVSVEGLDATIRDGLGLRWVLMGPIETIDLNAPGGIEDYMARYAGFYRRLAGDPAGPEVYDLDRAARIAESWPQERGPEAIRARQDRRDLRLAALRRHLHNAGNQ
ncbi:3-hydroxyacyl-CoA dehydrogenase [Palleronia aestuarii]|uniref:3-hydroxyacyl-CoA dehydrogenase n=1 Tax=Palleronia aestuarii TaxID=568105 RepID=A0A2W7N5B1_9RHOB|nr:3-hydroxyacyl-CoA dehydrogenase [Palleronia aestuarii]PZX14913.1 3-hydroxyacyl-CoA dehydrogenase [Palleronia aestuarii]